jgi:hypothetical protein
MPERVPTEMAQDSDFLGRWFQVRLVERTWPVRQFAFAVWAGKYSVLIDWVWTLQSPVPQDLGQSRIERNRLARGFGLAVSDVLHDDRADDMDLHLLKINVLPLEAQQLPNPKAREHGEEYHRARRLLQQWEAGYNKDEELEADREGMRVAVLGGYSAYGSVTLFEKFAKLHKEYIIHAQSPEEELSQLAIQSLEGYFRSHP